MTSPTMPAIRVDHVGIAVDSVPDAEGLLFAFGCEKIHEERSEYGEFTWATYVLGDASRLELIAPDDGTNSFLTDFLERNGPGLHHVTLEVADLEAAVEALDAAGVSVVDRQTFEHWHEAFVTPQNPTGVLFQLMEYREGYADDRAAGDRLFVHGVPVPDRRDSTR
ncbi:VOC family protein [Natrialba aegyptia]|uniref:Glyoxalase/bleomycin resistance protein/dioxygenase n=1 Tax=Natrialba aegyptia DSM 13077 TaxID=1227491 RepID=M0B343_9EURY|nr:VOC family protein [Natrialba aegyptia]ELZ04653.1 glyoxalase/bleomycin resistance protein/dioxygenase [Natrialba aegyptia DSM 13077]